MRVSWREVEFVDPEDRSRLRLEGDSELVSESGRTYGFVSRQPNLLPPDGVQLGLWKFPPIAIDDIERPRPTRPARRRAVALKRWFEPAGDRRAAIATMQRMLESTFDQPELLVVGGASIGHGLDGLLDNNDIRVISFDIYPTPDTTFVADAHRIPLNDGSVDAVIVQAVLEHVYRPDIVVAEIRRVLRPGGLVYAETPFLQPVHEGAYDFTRFTVSGHRLLFEGLEALAYGPIGGPGALMNLAVRGMVGGMTRSSGLAKIVYVLVLPMRLLDRAMPRRWQSDFAIGAYFVGRRSSNDPVAVDPVEIYQMPNDRITECQSGGTVGPELANRVRTN